MSLYSVVKKNKIMSFAGNWMEPETILLSERSQTQKVKGPCFLSSTEVREEKNGKERWGGSREEKGDQWRKGPRGRRRGGRERILILSKNKTDPWIFM